MHSLFPAWSDKETYVAPSLWDIKCIIQEAFLPCQLEPSWQTFSLLRKQEEASWFHREYLLSF